MQSLSNSLDQIIRKIQYGLVVSCQAPEEDPFYGPEYLARFAQAAVLGGAVGIRADGPANIRSIREGLDTPIIGIQKVIADDGRVLITPTVAGAFELVAAGADLVAVDCTRRGQAYGALERIAELRKELGPVVVADIATEVEAVAAVRAGASMVLSTMRGYTRETEHITEFDPRFIASLVKSVDVPVLAEGMIQTPEQACLALEAGALAVIVGTAITRPALITKRFASALRAYASSSPDTYVIGIDLGGTNIKCGVVSAAGELLEKWVDTTPTGGRDALLDALKIQIRRGIAAARERNISISAVGVATAGWVDAEKGSIVYATENLPGWTGTDVRGVLEEDCSLPVFVENDCNALAHGEHRFGAAQGVDDFLCITLGTGVGGACYTGGSLVRGAHCMANALGHVQIRQNGLPCTCGQSGCLEVYSNAAALVRVANSPDLASADKVIAASNVGRHDARNAVLECAEALADGCATMIHLLDPRMIILSGGLVQDNPILVTAFEEALQTKVMAAKLRHITVRVSALGYHGGVFGAAAWALRGKSSTQ